MRFELIQKLEVILNKPNLICVYIVNKVICDNILTLMSEEKTIDKLSIPIKYKQYIYGLLDFTNVDKNINISKFYIKKFSILNPKPLRPVFSRTANTYKVEDGLSLVDNNKDLPFNKMTSPFGEFSFGEDRVEFLYNYKESTFKAKFNNKIAARQLYENIDNIRNAIGSEGLTEEIWAISRFDNSNHIELFFVKLADAKTTQQSKIATTSYSEMKKTPRQEINEQIQQIKGNLWYRFKDDKQRIVFKNAETDKILTVAPPAGSIIRDLENFKYKYLKYKQKYLEAKNLYNEELQNKELEGGAPGDYTFIFCPEEVMNLIKEAYKDVTKFNDINFFKFIMGPKSFYTEQRSHKLCRCWGDCDEKFWTKSFGIDTVLFKIEKAIEHINEVMPSGNFTYNNKEYKDYKYFYFKSNWGKNFTITFS